MVLLIVVERDRIGEVAKRLNCEKAPEKEGDFSTCGEYDLYLQYCENSQGQIQCYLGITLAKYWRGMVYLSEEAERDGAYTPQRGLDLLKRLADMVLMAVVSRAPTVTGYDDNVFISLDYLWIREGYTPTGKARDVLAYTLEGVVALDADYLIDIENVSRERYLNGFLIQASHK